MSVMPAYGIVILPPPDQTFPSRSGMTYTVAYRCLTSIGMAGYATEIFIHNTQRTEQYVYIKILDILNRLSAWANSGSPEYVLYRWTIPADGLLWIDCNEIGEQLGLETESKGIVVISHPGGSSTIALDVMASYKFVVPDMVTTDYVGGSWNVVYVPGVHVSKVPTPCVMVKPSTTCQTLPL